MRKTFLTAVLMTLATTAMAGAVSVGAQGQKINVTVLATVEANPGETDEAFFLRKGMMFRGITASTGFEACAMVCRDAKGRPGMVVSTSNAHIGCATMDACPAGMTATPLSIHSHPTAINVELNDNDRVLLELRDPGTRVKRHERRMLPNDNKFSDIDYDGGPGYLVRGDVLLYQNGPGTARVVGTIPQYHD